MGGGQERRGNGENRKEEEHETGLGEGGRRKKKTGRVRRTRKGNKKTRYMSEGRGK